MRKKLGNDLHRTKADDNLQAEMDATVKYFAAHSLKKSDQ